MEGGGGCGGCRQSVDAPLGLGVRRKGSSPMAMSRDFEHALDPCGPWGNGHGERNAEI